MNKSYCSSHEQEEQKYICVHPTCLQKADNKLCCSCCFQQNHREKKAEQHKIITLSELEKTAHANYTSLKEHLLNEVKKNSELHAQIEEQLSAILLSLTNWQNNQKKMFNDITENSSQVLAQNIQKAENLIENPSLDTFIYFYKFNLQDKQNEMQDIRDQSTRQLNYQLNQIEMKRDILINQKNFIEREHFLKFAQMDYQIEVDNLNNFQFEQCELHLSQKELLCTHLKCLEKDPLKLECSLCILQDHKEHQQDNYIKTLAIVMKEQTEKRELIEQLTKKFNKDINKSIKTNLQKIDKNQNNSYESYEQQKESAVFLGQQQLSCILKPEIPNYIFGHLDQNLLTKTKEQINFSYDQFYQNFESKFSKIFSDQVIDVLNYCTELDFNSQRTNQYIINLEKELEMQKQKVEEQEIIIQSNTLNHSKIKQQLNTQNDTITNFLQKLEKEISNLQSLNLVKSDLENKKVQDLQNSFQASIDNFQSLTFKNSEQQNTQINNLQNSLQSSIDKLQSITQKNSEQQNQNFKDISQQKTSQINSVSKIQIWFFIIVICFLYYLRNELDSIVKLNQEQLHDLNVLRFECYKRP